MLFGEFFNEYPYRNISSINLDWLIKQLQKLEKELINFVSLNTITYADPIQWSITRQYKMNTVVVEPVSKTAYISTKPVPIGVRISDTNYWTPIFDLNQLSSNQNITLREDGYNVLASFPSHVGDWLIWQDLLYKVVVEIPTDTPYMVEYNIERYTVEMFVNDLKTEMVNRLYALSSKIGDLTNLTTTEKNTVVGAINELVTKLSNEIDARQSADSALQSNIDAEVTARQSADSTLQSNIDAEATARQNADNQIIEMIGDSYKHPLDVTLLGVKGDGITNEVSAFQSIITDYPDYAYYFPKGVYNFTGGTFSGNLTLIGDGDATLINFKYEDLNFPILNRTSSYNPNQHFLSVTSLKFQSTEGHYALSMHVQSQGSVMRCFDIRDCVFLGDYGINFVNCITGNIHSCDFIKNVVGIKFESSTNISIVECNWYSPVRGIIIDTSNDDSAHRYGGESIMLTSCQMIDGVVGIHAIRHNYLQLNDCMFDYMNLNVYLNASRFARFVNTYLGADGGDKSSMHGYIAPPQYGCVWGYSSIPNVPFTGEFINCEFCAYSDITTIPFVMNGTGTTRGEDIDVIGCRFTAQSATDVTTIMYITTCSDVLVDGNRFYAPNNNHISKPFAVDDCVRTIISNNDYVNCFKSNSTPIVPSPRNLVSNMTYQEVHILSFPTDGSSQATTARLNFNATYDGAPNVAAILQADGTDYYKCILSIHDIDNEHVTLNLYRPDANLNGTYKARVIVMREMY